MCTVGLFLSAETLSNETVIDVKIVFIITEDW